MKISLVFKRKNSGQINYRRQHLLLEETVEERRTKPCYLIWHGIRHGDQSHFVVVGGGGFREGWRNPKCQGVGSLNVKKSFLRKDIKEKKVTQQVSQKNGQTYNPTKLWIISFCTNVTTYGSWLSSFSQPVQELKGRKRLGTFSNIADRTSCWRKTLIRSEKIYKYTQQIHGDKDGSKSSLSLRDGVVKVFAGSFFPS